MIIYADPMAKNEGLNPSGLVESATVNSFADFVSSNLNDLGENDENELNDFINIIICHMIFYSFFCIALVLHILIDLGIGLLVKNKFLKLIEITNITGGVAKPALA